MSAVRIMDDIARTRARLSHSLMLLDREYGLRHLFLRGTRLLHETGADPGGMREAARENILPLSVIGIGLAWLTFAARREQGDGSPVPQGLAHLHDLVRYLLSPRDHPASHDPSRN